MGFLIPKKASPLLKPCARPFAYGVVAPETNLIALPAPADSSVAPGLAVGVAAARVLGAGVGGAADEGVPGVSRWAAADGAVAWTLSLSRMSVQWIHTKHNYQADKIFYRRFF